MTDEAAIPTHRCLLQWLPTPSELHGWKGCTLSEPIAIQAVDLEAPTLAEADAALAAVRKAAGHRKGRWVLWAPWKRSWSANASLPDKLFELTRTNGIRGTWRERLSPDEWLPPNALGVWRTMLDLAPGPVRTAEVLEHITPDAFASGGVQVAASEGWPNIRTVRTGARHLVKHGLVVRRGHRLWLTEHAPPESDD